MTTSDPVERVARAIQLCAVNRARQALGRDAMTELPEGDQSWTKMLPEAKSAIAAMSPPPADSGVVEADAAERVMKALWPLLGGNHTEAELWHEIGDAVTAALAKSRTGMRP